MSAVLGFIGFIISFMILYYVVQFIAAFIYFVIKGEK